MKAANFYAQEAISCDKAGKFDAAIQAYLEASRVIFHLIKNNKVAANCKDVAQRYLERANFLQKKTSKVIPRHDKTEHFVNVQRAEFLLNEAFAKDESEDLNAAQELFAQAVEFCLKCSKSSANEEQSAKFRELALSALERAELIKSLSSNPKGNDLTLLPAMPIDEISQLSFSNHVAPFLPDNYLSTSSAQKMKHEELEKSELKVLASTSKINEKSYVPFMNCDLKERFAYPVPFSDKDGLLLLSEKQRKRLDKWMRPDEFMESPKMIGCIDSRTIKQTIVSDCSFIASLAIAARYERLFGKRLITHIIYPQNKHGEPIYNPCGKYMIRLHINGIWRKVIIDDRLPIGGNGELLCSYSNNKNELWVSLLEKAYMKVMGGYDFPGSNSNIDLNALTGWIPERIAILKNSTEFQANKVFEQLFARFNQGDCLITLATGQMPKSEQDRTGLVDAHAYAVLEMRNIKGKRLLLVKNPWTHVRWKGRYSEKDASSWTFELCEVLNYNPKDAQQFDDGVFWIDFESVCEFFDVLYVNWNPKLFPFTYALHLSWNAGIGPVKDLYTVGDNPQYFLEVNNNLYDIASVWILLTRHITDKEDFADNKEYITVIVYKSGKRIYFPHDPKPLINGSRINSPHYLCKLMVTEPGLQRYTLVIAQYEKTNTINYTLRVYSSAEFKCSALKISYKKSKKEAGEWRGKTAGGCGVGDSHKTYQNNPIYHVSLDDGSDENELLIELRGPKEYSIGFEFTQISATRSATKLFERRDSGAFRPGYTVLQVEGVSAGVYAIRPMTFIQAQEGPFILRVDSSCGFVLKRVQ